MIAYFALLCYCLALVRGQTCPLPTQYYDNTTMGCIDCPITGLDPKCASANCTSPSPTTCYSCVPGYNLDITGKCNAICAIAGTYYNVTTTSCANCAQPTNCGTYSCDNSTDSTCSVCTDGFTFDASNNCNTPCPSIINCQTPRCTNTTNICVNCIFPWSLDAQMTCTAGGPANCTASQYLDTSTNVCVDCAIPNNCATGGQRCTANSTSSTCVLCATGFGLDMTGNCVATMCNSTQFLDISSNTCQDCPLPSDCMMQTCQSATVVTCVTCNTGFVLGAGGVCVAPSACTGTQFLDPTTNLCVDCPFPSMCTTGTCTSTTDVTCTACTQYFALISNMCQQIPTCLPTQYLNAAANVCVDCTVIANCFSYTCSGATDSTCSICNTNYVLDPGTMQCIARLSCTSLQYTDPTGNCTNCPFVGSCTVGTCTGPNDAVCTICANGYTLQPSGACQLSNVVNSPCNLCPAAGATSGCQVGAVCCGCSTGGSGTCALACTQACTQPTCPDTCPTPDGCQTRGGCQAITTGTCVSCFISYDPVTDAATGLVNSCVDTPYRSCDPCNNDVTGCGAGTACCCGTCRPTCPFHCDAPDCSVTTQETADVITEHTCQTTCEDSNNIGVVENMVKAHVKYVLGAWLQGDGTASYNYECRDNGKRQSSATVTTDITLSGTNANYQAQILEANFPTNGTANGISVSLNSVSGTSGGGGLSGGAIAGIVIGSIVGVILVIVIVYVVVNKSGDDVESV